MPSHISFEVADMNRQDEKGADQNGVVVSRYVEVMAYDRVLESLEECSQDESCTGSYGNKLSATIARNTFKCISPGVAHRSFWQPLKLEVGREHGAWLSTGGTRRVWERTGTGNRRGRVKPEAH